MERGLQVPLSQNEQTTLRLLAKGLPNRVSYRMRDLIRLLQLGLLRRDSDGYELTELGTERIAKESTRDA
jgi:hypothetical protein